MMSKRKLISFDWAIKRLLRQKANFDILEGFLSELLKEDIHIEEILESESNKQHADDKLNRVDLLVKNSQGELLLIEVQNIREDDYFHRMLYASSKLITEHIAEGQPYAAVKKVIAINIVYFDLGHGKDYVYRGTTRFEGIHQHDVLELSARQKELYGTKAVGDLYPEYYVLKVNQFDEVAKDTLDEWIYFLKTSETRPGFSAKGLKAAEERLSTMKLDEAERQAYDRYLENLRYAQSLVDTANNDVKIVQKQLERERTGREQAEAQAQKERIERERAEAQAKQAEVQAQKERTEREQAEAQARHSEDKLLQTARNLKALGMSTQQIAQATQLSEQELEKL